MPSRSKAVNSAVVVAAIGLLGTLASAPAFGQVVPPTLLRVSVTRAASELVTAADGGLLDLITYGGTATYSVTVQNIGPSRAYSVALSGSAPTGPTATKITAVTPASCTISTDGSTFTCANLGDLPDGILADGGFLAATSTISTVKISLALPPRPYGTTCTLPDGGPVQGNSFGPLTLTASATNAPPVPVSAALATTTRALADLAVTMTGPDTASEYSSVAYQVHAQNNGPCAANRVRLTNFNATNGLTLQSNSGGCASGYPCTLGTWPAGASVDVTSTYTVEGLPVAIKQAVENQQLDIASTNTPNPDGGTIPVVFATPDPVAGNNSASVPTSVMHDTGCSSVGAGSLGFVGVALAAMGLIRRRRRA